MTGRPTKIASVTTLGSASVVLGSAERVALGIQIRELLESPRPEKLHVETEVGRELSQPRLLVIDLVHEPQPDVDFASDESERIEEIVEALERYELPDVEQVQGPPTRHGRSEPKYARIDSVRDDRPRRVAWSHPQLPLALGLGQHNRRVGSCDDEAQCSAAQRCHLSEKVAREDERSGAIHRSHRAVGEVMNVDDVRVVAVEGSVMALHRYLVAAGAQPQFRRSLRCEAARITMKAAFRSPPTSRIHITAGRPTCPVIAGRPTESARDRLARSHRSTPTLARQPACSIQGQRQSDDRRGQPRVLTSHARTDP